MESQISLEQINEFRNAYNNDKTNKIIENAITKNGLENTCIRREIIIENQPVFNIELPESKRYHQKDSWKCWIFAGLNLIKHNIAKNFSHIPILLSSHSNLRFVLYIVINRHCRFSSGFFNHSKNVFCLTSSHIF
jgi:aminopeptidase C